MIGIIGGMGSYAGTYLTNLIFDNTVAINDQQHLPIILYSLPQVGDRTDFILNKTETNPALTVSEIIPGLECIGVDILAVSCNTFYSPIIFNVLVEKLKDQKSKIKIVNPIEETVKYVKQLSRIITKIGVLSTNGTYQGGLYNKLLRDNGFDVFIPDKSFQNEVIHKCIYDEEFGFKSRSKAFSEKSINLIQKTIRLYRKNGVNTIILGCSEFSYFFNTFKLNDIIVIDAMNILARALIKAKSPTQLKSFIFESNEVI